MVKPRKAHGEGRMCCQKRERIRKAKILVEKIHERLDMGRVMDTQVLFGRGTLRRKENAELFGFICAEPRLWSGRVFTRRLALLVIKRLRARLEEPLPTTKDWVEQQVGRFLKLAQRAKKGISPSMDTMETQPLQVRALVFKPASQCNLLMSCQFDPRLCPLCHPWRLTYVIFTPAIRSGG